MAAEAEWSENAAGDAEAAVVAARVAEVAAGRSYTYGTRGPGSDCSNTSHYTTHRNRAGVWGAVEGSVTEAGAVGVGEVAEAEAEGVGAAEKEAAMAVVAAGVAVTAADRSHTRGMSHPGSGSPHIEDRTSLRSCSVAMDSVAAGSATARMAACQSSSTCRTAQGTRSRL